MTAGINHYLRYVGIAISLFLVAISFVIVDGSATIGIIAIGMYLGFFSLGMGPGAWLIPSEVFSTTIRAKAMSMATFLNRVTATIVTSSFLSVADVLTWPVFFSLLGFVSLIILGFYHVFLPETKGRSLEDMSVFFAELTGDRAVIEAEKRLHGDSAVSSSPSNQSGLMAPSSGTLA